MKVLLVAWGLPPCREAGVYRALSILGELVDMGADVVALTASRETFETLYGADTGLEAHIPHGVELVRVPFFPEQLWPVVNDWSFTRVHKRAEWSNATRQGDYRAFPEDVYASWVRPATAQALSIAAGGDVDLVIATGNPYVDFEVAYATHEAFAIPFVLDDRDSFLFDVFTGEKGRLFDPRMEHYEAYLAGCVEYWCVNPPIASLHREALPSAAEKVQVVENGWDSRFPPFTDSKGRGPTSRIGLVGTVTSGFPVDDVLDAWHAVQASSSESNELHIFGDVGSARGAVTGIGARLVDAADDGVVLHGHVSKPRIADAYESVDALLFVKERSPLITSARVYEYAATGLPIAALGLRDTDAGRVLDGYPRLHLAPAGIEGGAATIRAALQDAHSDGSDQRAETARAFGSRLQREVQVRPALERVLGKCR